MKLDTILDSIGVRIGMVAFAVSIASRFITPLYGEQLTSFEQVILTGVGMLCIVIGLEIGGLKEK